MGRRLRSFPGSAEVRIAAYDGAAGRLVVGPDGFARRCGRGETGMLLVTAGKRDGDGDVWFVGDGTAPVEDAMYAIAAVDLCVVYRVGDLLVAAVTRRDGATLDEKALSGQTADVVRVVDEIPTTSWFRLVPGPLRAEGIPVSTAEHPAWVLSADGTYKKLTAARRTGLTAHLGT